MTPAAARYGASLLPVAAFGAAGVVADQYQSWRSSLVGFILASPLVVGFVALPTWLPLAVARRRWVRCSVVATMSTVAAATAVAIVTSEDAQAGVAIIYVPCAGVALAIAVVAGEAWRKPPRR